MLGRRLKKSLCFVFILLITIIVVYVKKELDHVESELNHVEKQLNHVEKQMNQVENELNQKNISERTKITTKVVSQNEIRKLKSRGYKIVLLWGDWHGSSWESGSGPASPGGLRNARCPTWKCSFIHTQDRIPDVDAVVFRSELFKNLVQFKYRRPTKQRWILLDKEPPGRAHGNSPIRIASTLVNWTMHYHSSSDVKGGFYGHFVSLDNSTLPFQANFIEENLETLESYEKILEVNSTLKDVIGPTWTTYVNKPRIVAWLVSNCNAMSRRQDYVEELQKYVPIDIYGKCKNKPCVRIKSSARECWEKELGSHYSFYLAFENNFCDEYVTEKLYFSLVHGVIPVVYGGADYKQLLPPNSYINARDYHPRQLAELLKKLHHDPGAIERYHLWRGFWRADNHGSFCHLCHRLHMDSSHQHHTDINAWIVHEGHCKNPAQALFNNAKFPYYCKEFINTNLSCVS